jgi:hypothetical protein
MFCASGLFISHKSLVNSLDILFNIPWDSVFFCLCCLSVVIGIKGYLKWMLLWPNENCPLRLAGVQLWRMTELMVELGRGFEYCGFEGWFGWFFRTDIWGSFRGPGFGFDLRGVRCGFSELVDSSLCTCQCMHIVPRWQWICVHIVYTDVIYNLKQLKNLVVHWKSVYEICPTSIISVGV